MYSFQVWWKLKLYTRYLITKTIYILVSFHTLYFECFFEVLFLFQVKPFSNRCIQKSIYFYVIFFINIKILPVFLAFFGRISNDWKANFFLVLGHLKSIGNLLYFYMFPLLLLFIPKQCHAHNSTQWSMVWKSQSVRESFLQPFFQIKSIVTQRDKRSVKVVLIMIHFCMLNERFSHSYVYSIWLFMERADAVSHIWFSWKLNYGWRLLQKHFVFFCDSQILFTVFIFHTDDRTTTYKCMGILTNH